MTHLQGESSYACTRDSPSTQRRSSACSLLVRLNAHTYAIQRRFNIGKLLVLNTPLPDSLTRSGCCSNLIGGGSGCLHLIGGRGGCSIPVGGGSGCYYVIGGHRGEPWARD
jgi:hypothetical protein